jgi:hypothetical protein
MAADHGEYSFCFKPSACTLWSLMSQACHLEDGPLPRAGRGDVGALDVVRVTGQRTFEGNRAKRLAKAAAVRLKKNYTLYFLVAYSELSFQEIDREHARTTLSSWPTMPIAASWGGSVARLIPWEGSRHARVAPGLQKAGVRDGVF